MAFPSNPTNNQTYNDGTYTYRYNSTFRTWTKIAQTTSNVSNVVTTGGNITTGNTTITGSNLTVGNTTLTTSNVTVGNTVVSSSNLTVGNTVVSSSNVSVGNTTITNSNVVVGNTIISNNELTGNLANGNTSISIPSANGNVAFSSGGTSNVFVISPTGADVLGTANITGNVNGGNLSTLGTLSVSGNANIGNIGANNAVFTGSASFGANVNMANFNITNLAEPVASNDAATKNYVDSVAQGLHVHDSCYVATTGNLDAASGGTVSYNNGTSGVGATLTTTGTYLLIDGGNVQTVGTRILVKNEANAAWNGIYTYTSTTVLTRATDFDTTAEAAGGDFLFVTSGATNADTGWVQTTDNPVIGTDPIVFTQFSGAGTYKAGTGLTLTGEVFSVNASQTQVTSVGTLSGLTVAGNIGVGNITATGNITAANFVGVFANGNSEIRIPSADGNINIDVGGSTDEIVITSTGVNVAGYLTVTGNGTFGNVYANSGTVGASLLTGTLTTTAQPNVTSVGTLSSLSVTGNISTANLTATGNISNTRINLRTANNGATTSGTITPNANTSDQFNLIGLTGTVTIAIPSGTFVDGQRLTIRIKDNGVAQTLNWTVAGANSYRVIGTTLPSSTTAGKVSYVGCVYNSQDSFWDVVAVTTQA